MTRLYQREAFIIAEGIRIEGLRLAFKVEKTLAKQPNKCEVQLYNLTKDSRAKLQQKGAPLVVAAGYSGSMGQLFLGETREGANHERQGPDWATKVNGSDGHAAFAEAEVTESFGPGTGVVDIVKKLAQRAGVGIGNAVQQLGRGNFRGAMDQFVHGFSANGKASSELDRVLRTAGFAWSIQDGQLLLLRGQDTLGPNDAVLLSPETGLIGSPEFGEAEKKQGAPKLKAKSLLNAQLKPGATVELQSEAFQSRQFRIEKVVHEGDTHGANWYSSIEARPL